ncbi:MAG: hypothetical protein ACXADH_14750 [Candidatus Kariarchaeaceae archaeon]|jgi:hypothetical protein
MDNWKNVNVNHPKKGLVPIKNLSNNEKGRAIVDLSHRVSQVTAEHQAMDSALKQVIIQYQNHIASLDACTLDQLRELYGYRKR